MSNNTVQPAIVVFDKDRTEVLGIAPEGTTDITYLSTISEAQVDAGATAGVATNAAGEMIGRSGSNMGKPVGAVTDPVTGGSEILLPDGEKILSGHALGGFYGLITVPNTRMEYNYSVDGTNGTCFHQVFWLPDSAGVFRYVYANGGSSAYTVAKAAMRPIFGNADFLASASDYATLGSITFAGGASLVVPAEPSAGGRRIGLARSDWKERAMVARTDGFSGTLIAVRSFVAAGAGTITLTGAVANDTTNWATRPDGKYYVARAQNVDGIATPASFTSTTNISTGPIIGVEFISNGRMFTIGVGGDSIPSGAGSTYYGEGFPRIAADALAAELGIPVNTALLTSPGAGWDEYKDVLSAWLALGIKPDLIYLPGGTPNSVSTWDTLALTSAKSTLGKMKAVCTDAGIPYMMGTVFPANYASKTWGATDATRISYNAAMVAAGNCVDVGATINGSVEGHGQMEPAVGLINADGLHPTDAGNALAAPPFKNLARRFLVGGVAAVF